ncbi:hypothetical protein BJ741DRAFT_714710 [Chytriomyces cf. hyalinus JEL632]|nr:hypothetical protein BJ741DRAFT_714710 [Chytriomyces cf. hyalinus JEL632]
MTPLHITQLPTETLFKIFLLTNSPKCAFSIIPRVCKAFSTVVSHRSIPLLANVEIISEEEEDGSNGSPVTLIQNPERTIILPTFRRVRVVGTVAPPPPLTPASLLKVEGYPSPDWTIHSSSSSLYTTSSTVSDSNGTANSSVVYVGVERTLKVHVCAIPEDPDTLVRYIQELMARGVCSKFGHLDRAVRVLFGTVQVAGRRRNTSPAVLGGFLRALKPVNITLWWWDSELIANLPSTAATSLCLPNMLPDGHIQARDMQLLTHHHHLPTTGTSATTTSHLKRLELFRPLPRQPWGLEAGAFAPLSALTNLCELVVRSGRLIGTQETLVTAILGLKKLKVLELPWSIDSRFGTRVLRELSKLESLQYLQVTSPDFFQQIPTHPWRTVGQQQSRQCAVREYGPGVVRLKTLGLNFMEPDVADLAVMVEGIIRCMPELETISIRINARHSNDTNGTAAHTYDFYGTIARDFLVRWLRRLESACPNLTDVGLELGMRMWGSRKSYADELVLAFATSRMRVRMCSPMGRIG